MPDVTQILAEIEQGNAAAADQLLPLVYDELRKLAAAKLTQENPGQTLQATALVHEAYLRLVDASYMPQWNGRGHFFAAAAEAMRRILIERARRKHRLKHGGGRRKLTLDSIQLALDTPAEELIEIDEAISALAEQYPEETQLVKLRYFGGLSMADSAQALGISRRTADRRWAFARAWLFDRLSPNTPP